MATKTQDLKYRIGADFGELRREAEKAGEATRKFQRELAELERKQREHRKSLTELGQGMATFGAAVVAGLGLAAKAAIDWESAFAGVRKTVDGSDQEIAALEGELRNLARTLPATHEEIAGVAEAAGQLGIKRQDIAKFTKTMVDLGETTNLTADEAATALAKFSNIMGVASKDADRLGSTLVALGNDGASTEADIIDMGLRIAGAGRQIGLSADEVLAFASSLSSVGIQAELGGSAISRVMVAMAQAVNGGGEKLEEFAKVAGVTVDDFSRRFRNDAAGAIIAFVSGLAKMQTQGQDVFSVLETLEFNGVGISDTLLRATGASEMFTKSLSVGAKSWQENTALTAEANKRYETSAAKIQVAWNQVKDALIDVGGIVLPVVGSLVSGISSVVDAWRDLPAPLQDVVVWAGLAVGGLAILGGTALMIVPKILAFRESMRALIATGGMLSGALGRFGLFLTGPWGAAIALGITALGAFALAQTDAKDETERFTFEIDKQTGALTSGGIEALSKFFNEVKVGGENSAYVRDIMHRLGLTTSDLIGWLVGAEEAQKKVNDAFAQAPGTGSKVLQQFMEKQKTALEDQKKAQDEATKASDQYASAEEKQAAATREANIKAIEQNKLLGETKSKAEEAAEALDKMVEALNDINGVTLSYRAAQRNYIEAVEATKKALAENGKTLDINTEKGRANAEAIDAQAKSAQDMAEAAAREAEKMGGAAAGAAAMTASLQASRGELVKMAMQFGMTKAQAEKYVDSVLAIPAQASTLVTTPGSAEAQNELKRVRDQVNGVPPKKDINVGVISAAARAELESIKGIKVTTNSNGTVTVRAETKAAQDALNAIANRPPIRIGVELSPYFSQAKLNKEIREIAAMTARGQAYGGIISYAQGGMYENHAPQIVKASPNMVRVWAEPDTDRESYIPWARDRRARATNILRATADAFGFSLVPRGRSASTMQSYGGGWGGGAYSVVNLNVGMIGSQAQLLDWLVRAQDTLRRQQRM